MSNDNSGYVDDDDDDDEVDDDDDGWRLSGVGIRKIGVFMPFDTKFMVGS